jgi:ABC-type sugar transport system substrate-binding protein
VRVARTTARQTSRLKKMRRKLGLVTVIGTTALGLNACGSAKAPTDKARRSATEATFSPSAVINTYWRFLYNNSQPVSIAYVANSASSDIDATTWAGIQQEAKDLHVSAKLADGHGSQATQARVLDRIANSGKYEVVILDPINAPRVMNAVRHAVTRGIEVITADGPLGASLTKLRPQVRGVVASVMQTAVNEGTRSGELASAACAHSSQCHVAYVSTPSEGVHERVQQTAFAAALSRERPDAVTITTAHCGSAAQHEENLTHARNVVVESQECLANIGKNEPTPGAGDVVAIAPWSTLAVKSVKSGRWYGFSPITPYANGEIAVQCGVAAARGSKMVNLGIDPANSLPNQGLVTKATVVAFGPHGAIAWGGPTKT